MNTTLKKRHQSRKFWIGLTEELKKVYIDNYGNMMFVDQYLEEIIDKLAANNIIEEKNALSAFNLNTLKLLKKIVKNTDTQVSRDQNLKKVSEKFVIEKW